MQLYVMIMDLFFIIVLTLVNVEAFRVNHRYPFYICIYVLFIKNEQQYIII